MGGEFADRAAAVAVGPQGSAFVAGSFRGTASFGATSLTSSGDLDGFIARYTPEGTLKWVKNLGSSGADQASAVAADSNGNVYVAGSFSGTVNFGSSSLTSNGAEDIFLVKYDADGELLWAGWSGGADSEQVLQLFLDASGKVHLAFLSSSVQNGSAFANTFVAIWDSSGSFHGALNAGGIGGHVSDISFDAGGNTYVTGDFTGTMTIGDQDLILKGPTSPYLTYSSIFTAKFNPEGGLDWAREAYGLEKYTQEGYPASVESPQIATDKAGNVYISGIFYSGILLGDVILDDGFDTQGEMPEKIFLAQYDNAGNPVWAKWVASKNGGVDIVDLVPDAEDNLYLAYHPLGFMATDPTANINKYDTEGNLIWQIVEDADYDNPTPIHHIAVDEMSRLYMTFSLIGELYLIGTTGTEENTTPITSDDLTNRFTAVYDNNGSPLWVKQVETTSVASSEKGAYVAGSFKDTVTLGNISLRSKGETDAFLTKVMYEPDQVAAPVFTTFSPREGLPGDTVRLRGTALATTHTVLFNGVEANFEVISDTQLRAVVPATTTTGRITIQTAGGKDVSGKLFTVLQPQIAFFAPWWGHAGSAVYIAGRYLSTTKAVRFNGVKAKNFSVYNDYLVRAEVPAGATTGRISLELEGGATATSAWNFQVTGNPWALIAFRATADSTAIIPGALAQEEAPLAYPNPFTGSVRITANLGKAAPVRLVIYSEVGQVVREISFGQLPAGQHDLLWDGNNSQHTPVAPGLYFYHVLVGDKQLRGKLLKAGSTLR